MARRGAASVNIHEEEVLGKAFDWPLVRRMVRYLLPYRGWVLVAVLTLVAAQGIAALEPLFVKWAVDGPIAERDHGGLLVLLLAYLGLMVVRFAAEYVQAVLLAMIGQNAMYDLRMELYRHMQRMSLRWYDRNPVGRLLTRLTSDIEALNEMLSSGVVAIVGDLFGLIFVFALLFWLSPPLALAILAVTPILLGIALWYRINARHSFRNVRIKLAAINAWLQEAVSGIRVIQVFGREKRAADRFHDLNDDHMREWYRSIYLFALFNPVVEMLLACALGAILYVGLGLSVEGTLTIGVLIAVVMYAQRIFQPLSDLSQKYVIFQAAMAAGERIFQVLDSEEEIADPEDGGVVEGPRPGAVEFRDVHFRYLPDEPVLRGISFKVEPGESVAIVGATGAGKSTIINLVNRFWDVDEGVVLVDGTDVREWDRRALRRRIGLVLQDVFLFSGDVRDNIALWDEDITDEQVLEAARTVHADRLIDRLPAGLDAEVAERGATFSVGEKQLLAFARALAHNPGILILDEATSSIDTETERLIQDAVLRLIQNRTSLIIAHRLSTIVHCDRILVLHKGEIREQGTHQELLAARGLYHRLHQLQYKDQDVEVQSPQ